MSAADDFMDSLRRATTKDEVWSLVQDHTRLSRAHDAIKQAAHRLRYIRAIASGRIHYGSNFGRLCTIERLSQSTRLPTDLQKMPKR